MVSGRQTGGLTGKTDHLICRRGSTRRVSSPLAYGLCLIFLCLNVGHELQGIHQAVVSMHGRCADRCNVDRCAISILGVSAGANNSDNISSSGCASSIVHVVQCRCASRCNLGALTFLNVQSYKRVRNRDFQDWGIGLDWKNRSRCRSGSLRRTYM